MNPDKHARFGSVPAAARWLALAMLVGLAPGCAHIMHTNVKAAALTPCPKSPAGIARKPAPRGLP
jgi:hypothetical protein